MSLAIHTPSCIWRRNGEIQKANQGFAILTGIPASMFRDGQLCVYELMDEDSAVHYWEAYGKTAFDGGLLSTDVSCTLKIPLSLTRGEYPPGELARDGDLNGHEAKDGASVPVATAVKEGYREIKCCFSLTIRRDAWGIPVAIMGQWIVSLHHFGGLPMKQAGY